VDFKFYPLRFEFIARQSLFFPPGKASNILRGALGVIFRSIACVPECRGANSCEIRQTCPYARLFEPAASGPGPSGLADPPRPFVFRARHLDGRTIQPGQPFHFDLNVFSLEPETLAYFILTFAALAREGLGPNRGRAELQTVRRLPSGTDASETAIFSLATQMISAPVAPVTVNLNPSTLHVTKLRVDFLAPTELKHEQKIVERPEFAILFSRIRDRISTLRSLYVEGPIEMDYQASGARAARVRLTHCQLQKQETARRSTRTGQSHSIGGFIGTAEYQGDLSEFLPWLEAAKYTGVGRQSVWGKGEVSVSIL